MKIELLHVPGCPNRTQARQNLDAAIASAGVDAVVQERVVSSATEAATMGMKGSPTVLIDGADAFGTDVPASLACRLYCDGAGVSGAPSVESLVVRLAS